MKEKKHNLKMVMLVITFTVLLIYLVNHVSVILYLLRRVIALLLPFLIGCGIAFVVNIPMRSIENSLFKNENGRLYKAKRTISMLLSYILILCFVALVIFVVVPEVGNTFASIREKLPGFVEDAKAFVIKYTERYPNITDAVMKIEVDWDKVGSMFQNNSSTIISTTVNIFSSIVNAVANIFVGIVFSIYILSQKENLGRQFKLVLYALFKEKAADEIMVFGKIANTTFSKFFTCQFREGLILGTMFAIVMRILGLPYPLTIGVLIAFTAMIPIFGAFIGLFIGAFLILVESPKLVIWFVILFFVLQFVENYFIYPKLVGGDIGLSAIWVLLAVMVGGDLMGVAGMLIFIPLVSVIYSYVRSIIYRNIKNRKINVDDKTVPDDVMPLMEGRRRLFQPKPRTSNDDGANGDDDVVGGDVDDDEQAEIEVNEEE